MRALTIVVLVLSGLWFGYWAIAARGLQAGVTGWLQAVQADGAAVGWSDVQVQGFPNRFDLTISDPVIGVPDRAQWRAGFFQMLALSYAPYRLIAVWPNRQTLTLSGQTLTLDTEQTRASVQFRPVPSLPLDHAELVADRGILTSSPGWSLAFDQVRFATRLRPDLVNGHQLGLDVTGLAPPAALRAAIRAAEPMPETVEKMHADITVQTDVPLDRNAFGAAGPHITTLDITDIRAQWGSVGVAITGNLTRNAAGRGEGALTLRLTDWRSLVALLRAAGALDGMTETTLTRALEVLETLDPDPATLEVPITFAGLRGTIAGLPLLAAPKF